MLQCTLLLTCKQQAKAFPVYLRDYHTVVPVEDVLKGVNTKLDTMICTYIPL